MHCVIGSMALCIHSCPLNIWCIISMLGEARDNIREDCEYNSNHWINEKH